MYSYNTQLIYTLYFTMTDGVRIIDNHIMGRTQKLPFVNKLY